MQEFITEKELEARAKQVIAPIPMPSGKIEYHKVSHESVFSYRAMIEVGIKEETLVKRAVEMQKQTGMSYPICFSLSALEFPMDD